MHPLNLALRFALELAMLASLGVWGRARFDGALGWVAAIGVPLLAATLWGVFAVPGDPSRGQDGVVAVPGVVRLALELGLFALAVLALRDTQRVGLAFALAALVALHYALSLARIRFLLAR